MYRALIGSFLCVHRCLHRFLHDKRFLIARDDLGYPLDDKMKLDEADGAKALITHASQFLPPVEASRMDTGQLWPGEEELKRMVAVAKLKASVFIFRDGDSTQPELRHVGQFGNASEDSVLRLWSRGPRRAGESASDYHRSGHYSLLRPFPYEDDVSNTTSTSNVAANVSTRSRIGNIGAKLKPLNTQRARQRNMLCLSPSPPSKSRLTPVPSLVLSIPETPRNAPEASPDIVESSSPDSSPLATKPSTSAPPPAAPVSAQPNGIASTSQASPLPSLPSQPAPAVGDQVENRALKVK